VNKHITKHSDSYYSLACYSCSVIGGAASKREVTSTVRLTHDELNPLEVALHPQCELTSTVRIHAE
jgi:hypothetical protein